MADKVVLVAGFGERLILDEDEEEDVARPWLKTPIDYSFVKKKAESFVAVFSDNDPYVPVKENSKLYKSKLGAKIIVEKEKGHYDEGHGIKDIPVLINILGVNS